MLSTADTNTEPQQVRSLAVNLIDVHLEDDASLDSIEFLSNYIRPAEWASIAHKTSDGFLSLYDDRVIPALIELFQWWSKAAEYLLPVDRERGYPLQECWGARERFIGLEADFWKAVAPARRQSEGWAGSSDEIGEEEPAKELVRRYMGYREAVRAYARDVLPARFCERIEQHI